MKDAPASRRSIRSAAIVPTLWLMLACFGLAAFVSLQAQPGWWGPQGQGAVLTPQVVTNGTIVTTNYVRNDYAVANQGQLKKFTVAAVNQLNTTLTNSGGAGPTLSNMVYNWHQDYLTNSYATSTNNPTRPYKPSDLQAVNVGQLKYIASLIYGQLANAGYSGLYPSWIVQNTTTDNTVANLGQLKQVFNFDLSVAPAAVSNLAISGNNPNELDLSWTLPAVDNASSIQVAVSSNGGATWTTNTVAATATSYAATGLIAGQNYMFQVTAGNSAGTSAPVSSPSPVAASTAAPAIVSATLGKNNTVNLSWSESNTNGVSGFNILQSTNGGVSFTQVDAVGGGSTSDTLSALPGAMDTSEFEVKAAAGSSTATSSPLTPVASSTNDTDIDGTNDNVDGWAGFTDKTQEAKLAPPRVPNPTYAAVTISTIPNTNPDGSTNIIDFVNAQGQAVVDAIQNNGDGTQTSVYSCWDKGATAATHLPYPPSMQDPSWGPLTVQSIQPTGLGDDGTVIGYANILANSPPSSPPTLFQNCEECWRWNKTMTQPQWLAELDNLDEVFNGSSGAWFIGWDEFLTTPISITFSNGVETIYAYHQEYGGNSNSPSFVKSYTEVYSSANSYQPTRYYATDNNAWRPNYADYIFEGTYSKTGSHESRTPAQDNGNGTVIGYGAEMDSWTNNTYGNPGLLFDLNVVIPSNVANNSQIWNLPLEAQPGSATAPPGGGMIVNTANSNNYRQWINGKPVAVNSSGYVLGMQNSTTPTNPTANAGSVESYTTTGPYYSYTDPASVPFPTIWAPQTSGGNVTGYTPITLTMPQTGLSFKGNAGMFLNKNLQIAGGFQGDPNAFPGEDTPFLWQNYQYHYLNDFFPGLSNYSKFKVMGLDDNGAITAIATPNATQANPNPNQQIIQLLPIVISQTNYPVPSTADSTTDSGATTVTKIINGTDAQGIALITGTPAMPQLTAKINGPDASGYTVDWRAAITSERTERGNKDNFDIPFVPGEGGPPSSGGPGTVDNQPINTPWNIPDDYPPSPQSFFGGNVTVYFTIKKADGTPLGSEQGINFKIRGLNPLDATAKSFITTGLAGGANSDVFQFAWAIVQHESREGNKVYNQFNPSGSTAELPDFGAPDGWGIAQLDHPLDVTASTDEVYNWHFNLSKFYQEVDEKIAVQQSFFHAIAVAYPTDTDAQNPPTTTLYGQSMTALAAGAITLYNGSGAPIGGTPCPTTTLGGVSYQNPWTFTTTPATGHTKWEYHPNGYDYLHQVVLEYLGESFNE